MQWTTPDLPASVPLTLVVIAAVVTGITQVFKRPNLNAFPTVGSSNWLSSWWDGIRYVINAADILHEGYRKYKGAPFRIATLRHWVVILNSRAHIEELRNARDDEFVFLEAISDDLNFESTMGFETMHNPYHVTVIRSYLTRHLKDFYPELQDEVVAALDDILDLKGNEWKSVPASTTIQQVVCRASNRIFVGLPLCRDPDFVALNIEYTVGVFTGGIAIGIFPNFLKSIVARLVTNVPKNIRRGVRHLRPIIEERRKYLNECANYCSEKPNDFLSRLIDEGGPDATIESIASHVMSTNFGAIHTTADVFTKALYKLAANPQYVQPLREEVEAIVQKEGWSKASLDKMRKINSFLKEILRTENPDMLGLTRKAKKDFTFSDGIFVPKGTRVNAGLVGIHFDDTLYENPEIFDPFRFADMDDEDGKGAKHQLGTTSPEFLSFGHGRHACAGRFFAAVEAKTMLAYLVTTYDVKLENTTHPRSLSLGPFVSADHAAKVMFRKRVRQHGKH